VSDPRVRTEEKLEQRPAHLELLVSKGGVGGVVSRSRISTMVCPGKIWPGLNGVTEISQQHRRDGEEWKK